MKSDFTIHLKACKWQTNYQLQIGIYVLWVFNKGSWGSSMLLLIHRLAISLATTSLRAGWWQGTEQMPEVQALFRLCDLSFLICMRATIFISPSQGGV